MEKHFDHKAIESKWQKEWEQQEPFHAQDNSDKEKFYALIEFPYPSGDGLHVGHVRSQTAIDVIARKKRMQGYNVLYPIGWDAFGLPTENFAIKTKQHPRVVTEKNVATFRRQIKELGIGFDWQREVNTTDPEYYKWTQWIFLQLYKNDLAYKANIPINWCPSCKIGLANEEVIEGKCERCGAQTERRQQEQWMLAITKYADRLIDDLDAVDYLPRIREQQINWIGRSFGAELSFKIENSDEALLVFTTRPDTLYGATYMVLAPEHELVHTLEDKITNLADVKAYIQAAQNKSELERQENKEKTGVELKGIKAINPATKQAVPIFIADYVLASYGTGAIMAVPAHDERDFEFAQQFGLEVIEVIQPEAGGDTVLSVEKKLSTKPYTGEGKLMNSGKFNHMQSKEAKEAITKKVGGKMTKQFKLRDWVFSRQHYWGEPIPIMYCRTCWGNTNNQSSNPKQIQNTNTKNLKTAMIDGLEHAVIPVPETELPVALPDVEKYEPTDTGESPLAAIDEWVNTTCPECDGAAKRETDTMPNWAGSSWYYLRYIDPHNNKALGAPDKLKYWTPVDLYNGGMEHTTLHLLYSRFWHKFLYDIKVVPTPEPYAKRVSHGMILAEDGRKMSKSLGNVINPDVVVGEFGADAIRLYEMFMGPYEDAIPWSTTSIIGVRRFIEKMWLVIAEWSENGKPQETSDELTRLFHKTIKKVTHDIDQFKFNTAVSSMMILVNQMAKEKSFDEEFVKKFVQIVSPFAPHITEELWSELGGDGLVCLSTWPEWNEDLTQDKEVEIVIQVNGKVRGKGMFAPNATENEIAKYAQGIEAVTKHTTGKEIVKQIYIPGRLLNIVVK